MNEGAQALALPPSLGMVLSYTKVGDNRISGQEIGGSGCFSFLIHGTGDECHAWVRSHLRTLRLDGHKLSAAIITRPKYLFGESIKLVNASEEKQ